MAKGPVFIWSAGLRRVRNISLVTIADKGKLFAGHVTVM